MPAPAASPRSAGVRTLTMLAVLAVALGAAFVAAPRVLAGGGFAGRHDLVTALRTSFIGYWNSGDRNLSPGLKRVVDYWFRYHVAKAAIAAILLVVLIALGVLIWKAFLRAGGRGSRAALASAGALVTMLTLLSLTVVMANIQGMVAPFASLLPMLTDGASGARLTGTLAQVRSGLAAPAGGDRPALDVMISDFSRYHVAMAVIASIVAVALIGISVTLWRRFAGTERSGRRTRRVLGSFGLLSALLTPAVIVLAVANATTAAHSARALLALFEGGW